MAVTQRTADSLWRKAADLYAVEERLRAEGFDAAADSLSDAQSLLKRSGTKIENELFNRDPANQL